MSGVGKTTCSWLGTAGWMIRHKDTTVVSDPYLSRPPGVTPFPLSGEDLAVADALLCTHGHFDHAFDLERVARLCDAPIWAPEVVCQRLRAGGIDPARLHPNESAIPAQAGDVGLEVVPSEHIRYDLPLAARTIGAAVAGGTFWSLVDLGLGWPMGSNSDYLLSAGGIQIYLSGSLGQSSDELRRHRPDVALLPYNGRTDMDRQVARAVESLRPRLVLLHHWDDFYPHFAPPQDPAAALPLLRRSFPSTRFQVARLASPLLLQDLL